MTTEPKRGRIDDDNRAQKRPHWKGTATTKEQPFSLTSQATTQAGSIDGRSGQARRTDKLAVQADVTIDTSIRRKQRSRQHKGAIGDWEPPRVLLGTSKGVGGYFYVQPPWSQTTAPWWNGTLGLYRK